MRSFIVYAAVALAFLALQPLRSGVAFAQTNCTGDDCQQQQQGGGRDCERKKNEQITS